MTHPSWSADALRAHFQRLGGPNKAEMEPASNIHVQAAVLVPLVTHPQATTVLLTRRTDHLRHHAGQISFPGGRREPADHSAVDVALRETEEEVGLKADDVEILGTLPELRTPSGFSITPVVGLLQPPVILSLDAFEVAEAFEVPLSVLANISNYQRHRIRWEGIERQVYAVPYRGRFIWGATASILATLADLLKSPADNPKNVDKPIEQR